MMDFGTNPDSSGLENFEEERMDPNEGASTFDQYDPRWQILNFFEELARAESSEAHVANVFTVWMPPPDEAIRNMMLGIATGKGFDIKGEPATRGNISSYVPFIQIHEESHKSHARALLQHGKSIRVFYQSEEARNEAHGMLLSVKESIVQDALSILHDESADQYAQELAMERLSSYDDTTVCVELVDTYVDSTTPVFGLDISEELFWESYITVQGRDRPVGTEWDTGLKSDLTLMVANLESIRYNKPGDPRAVVYQMDERSPMEPCTLVVAYEENGAVKPVVSGFNCFLIGSRGFKYEKPILNEQGELANWSAKNNSEGVDEKAASSTNAGWIEYWSKIFESFRPNAMLKYYGKGDPKSHESITAAVSRLQETGCVRDGGECFNQQFPRDMGGQFLVISNSLPGNTKWKTVTDTQDLQDFLIAKIDEGYNFQLPQWVLPDPGWKRVHDKLLASQMPDMKVPARHSLGKRKSDTEITEKMQEELHRYFHNSNKGLHSNGHGSSRSLADEWKSTAADHILARKLQDKDEYDKMRNTNDGKSVLAVQEIIESVATVRQKYGGINFEKYTVEAVAIDDMVFFAKNMLDKQEEFLQNNESGHIDIGYHFTDKSNMANIRTYALMTAAERRTNNVQARSRGSVFGDGVYTANSLKFESYGDTGLLVARLKGKMVRVARSLPFGQAVDANTIVGDKLRTTAMMQVKDGWPINDTFHEFVLRSSAQCLPMIMFDKKILQWKEGKNFIQFLNKTLQGVLDRLFNGIGCSDSDFRNAPLIGSARRLTAGACRAPSSISNHNPPVWPPFPAPLGVYANCGLSPSKQSLKYTAPQCLTVGIPSNALTETSCNIQDDCVICHSGLNSGAKCVALNGCNHVFHDECIQHAFQFKPQCPVCRVDIGSPQGKSPSGTMAVSNSPVKCEGFCVSSILIAYSIPSGYQLRYHDNPGMRHGGKNATAYLPMNNDGKDLLKRLKYSFKHGLTFTVGTSITTGKDNQCTWSSIHHKTSPSGGPRAHGYPDSDYFQNCNYELDALSVPRASLLDDDGNEISKDTEVCPPPEDIEVCPPLSVPPASSLDDDGNGPRAVSVGKQMATFRITIPGNVRPGEEFRVYAGGRIMRVRCPLDSGPGQSVQITLHSAK